MYCNFRLGVIEWVLKSQSAGNNVMISARFQKGYVALVTCHLLNAS